MAQVHLLMSRRSDSLPPCKAGPLPLTRRPWSPRARLHISIEVSQGFLRVRALPLTEVPFAGRRSQESVPQFRWLRNPLGVLCSLLVEELQIQARFTGTDVAELFALLFRTNRSWRAPSSRSSALTVDF